jgi:hypothetical protein
LSQILSHNGLNGLGFRMPAENEVAPEIVYDPADKKEREEDGMKQYKKYCLEEPMEEDGEESDDGDAEVEDGEEPSVDGAITAMEVDESDDDNEDALNGEESGASDTEEESADESGGSDEEKQASAAKKKPDAKKARKKPRWTRKQKTTAKKFTEKELEAELDGRARINRPVYYECEDGELKPLTAAIYRRLRTGNIGKTLQSNMTEAEDRKKFAEKVNKSVRGGYIDVPGVEKVCGSLRSCMQDTALTGAARIGVTVDKKTLYAERPPRKTKDTSRAEIESAPCLSGINFEWLNLNHSNGGPTAALLQKTDEGVFFVMSDVEGIEVTSHAFVYDSGYTDPKYPLAKGAIIDNRRTAPVRLLEPSDRVSAKASREAIDTFFGGAATFVTQVMRMTPKDSKKRGLDVVDCEANKRARN